MSDDGLFDIFAIEQKRLADEARARGDTKAASIHTRQATRFWELQRDERNIAARRTAEDAVFEAENPPYKMAWERQREALPEMLSYVHIHREGIILCKGGLFRVGNFPTIKAVTMKPELDTKVFHRGYLGTRFYNATRMPLCPACLVEDEMIKNGVVP